MLNSERTDGFQCAKKTSKNYREVMRLQMSSSRLQSLYLNFNELLHIHAYIHYVRTYVHTYIHNVPENSYRTMRNEITLFPSASSWYYE